MTPNNPLPEYQVKKAENGWVVIIYGYLIHVAHTIEEALGIVKSHHDTHLIPTSPPTQIAQSSVPEPTPEPPVAEPVVPEVVSPAPEPAPVESAIGISVPPEGVAPPETPAS